MEHFIGTIVYARSTGMSISETVLDSQYTPFIDADPFPMNGCVKPGHSLAAG